MCFHYSKNKGRFALSLVSISGVSPACTLWQRINAMQLMRHLCNDALMLQFLYVNYDAREDPKFKAVHEMIHCFSGIVESSSRLTTDFVDEEPLNAVAAFYQAKAQGVFAMQRE
jgi:Guanine nucleotide exchange factor in Golgi transport N-terminal